MSENIDLWILLRRVLILLWDKWPKCLSEKKNTQRWTFEGFRRPPHWTGRGLIGSKVCMASAGPHLLGDVTTCQHLPAVTWLTRQALLRFFSFGFQCPSILCLTDWGFLSVIFRSLTGFFRNDRIKISQFGHK